ncbi:hypothetical protein BDK51DRAFT_45980 [Blyttiomyces helicus]|uniref:Transmembrane protein 198 n=1 Tax=Blyttiomyces helicus TaxID=388810 RepID=A0A4P9WF74_9FUNG|nr:hypothetical protein BDK51DRAFT_45980 [Blyttiomyces helicus]|eukprot:RKO90383.1 hypothetical protein BDK51DRAFT_45980 [Blyttiomyces helicus]
MKSRSLTPATLASLCASLVALPLIAGAPAILPFPTWHLTLDRRTIGLPWGSNSTTDTGIPDALLPTGLLEAYLNLNVASTFTGALLLVTGFLFCFWGIRFFKLTLFLAGFYAGVILSYIIMNKIAENSDSVSGQGHWVYLAGALVGGLLIGALCVCAFRLACLVIGALFGLAIGELVMIFGLGTVVDGSTKTMIIVIFVVLGAVSVFFYERYIIIFGTALLGASIFVCGVDVFARLGLIELLTLAIEYQMPPLADIPPKVWGLAGGGLVMALAGIYVQGRPAHRKPDGTYMTGHPGWVYGTPQPPAWNYNPPAYTPNPPRWFINNSGWQ